jgi:2-polyprenyl-3-methyl-5-hydroxy-6-metoxy-1,4-benzoquinol methylase
MVWRIPFNKEVRRVIERSFQNTNTKSLKILDFGSGQGTRFANDNIDLHVVSLDIMEPCPSSHPLYIQYDGNVEKIPFPDKCFDIVIVSFVLHHIEKLESLLAELRRISQYMIVWEDIPDKSWFPYLAYRFCRSHYGFFYQDEKMFRNHIKTQEAWIDLFHPNAKLLMKKQMKGHITYGFVPHVIFLWKWKSSLS